MADDDPRISRDDALAFTQKLGQVFIAAGALLDFAGEIGVRDALGVDDQDWAEAWLNAYVYGTEPHFE